MDLLSWLKGAECAPYHFCFAEHPGLLALQASSDLLMSLSYFAIPFGIIWFLRRRSKFFAEYRSLAWLFGAFILACGLTHLIEAAVLWYPLFGLQAAVKGVTALVSIATVAVMWQGLPRLVEMPSAAEIHQANARLRKEVEAHGATLRELEATRQELETRVLHRTRELSETTARFKTALRGAKVYLFAQDRELKYIWVYSPIDEHDAARFLGHSEADVYAAEAREVIVEAKRNVLSSGEPGDCEVIVDTDGRLVPMALHIEPSHDSQGNLDGVICAAIDLTQIRSLESEQRRLASELATTLQRHEVALRGSNVTVFTNDRELRYTSISSGAFGREPDEVVGLRDEDLLPAESHETVRALKREALATGRSQQKEIAIRTEHRLRWYELYVEPLRDLDGDIIGLAGAAVEITKRKEDEAHLRLLMRELTHRSKNLLAVIQAMARQTARHASTPDAFVEQFSARLHGLAHSHDLLVQESWYGASLAALVQLQLQQYAERGKDQIVIRGPSVLLKPEAAQGLGLALHELASNAAKYGALSTPRGRVQVEWKRLASADGEEIEIVWRESGGPPVIAPRQRGFGSLVIERNLARSIDGKVDLTFAPEGVACRMSIPAYQVLEGDREAAAARQ